MNTLKVALGQISPVWLDKEGTLKKVESTVNEAAKNGCELIVFGEGLVPGYPFWLALTGGAEWDTKVNKELHAHYVRNSIMIEAGELDSICDLAKKRKIAVYLGINIFIDVILLLSCFFFVENLRGILNQSPDAAGLGCRSVLASAETLQCR